MARKPSVAACGYDSPDEEHNTLPASPHLPGGRRLVGCVSHGVVGPAATITTTISGPSSLNDMIIRAKGMRFGQKVGLRDRIACYRWTFFTMTMATGGVANVLFSVPYQSPWVNVVGTVFFLLNLVLFVTNCVLITMRFCFRPGSFLVSFTNQVESLFIPSFFVSIGMIFLTSCEYGTPHCGAWFLETMEVMFWLYIGVCMVASAGLYLILWSTQVFPLHTMTPIWVFPAYPLLLSAPLAGSLINAAITTKRVESIDAAAIATAAVAVQGTGFLISFMICSAFLYRLMTQKLPRDAQRPGVFIAIGPSGFTVAGLVNLGNQASLYLPQDFMGGEQSVLILRIMALMIGLSLWGLSIWFFLVAVGSLWKYCKPTKNMPFQMTFFSFVFPNTALVTATEQLGKAFDSTALKTVGSVFAACVVAVWAIVFYFMVHALWTRRLLWPKEDGDDD